VKNLGRRRAPAFSPSSHCLVNHTLSHSLSGMELLCLSMGTPLPVVLSRGERALSWAVRERMRDDPDFPILTTTVVLLALGVGALCALSVSAML
jgi:hypothetical protein